ncbi:MAG: hypothetical protein AABY22_11400 [Nanoarchaeota archaeon]
MSHTVSRGLHYPSTYTGVAADIAGYLEDRITGTNKEGFRTGAFRAAKQFLENIKYGIALNRKQRPEKYAHIELMTGISDLSIAVDVLQKTHPEIGVNLSEIEKIIDLYIQNIEEIQAIPGSVSKEDHQNLFIFFKELMQQGLKDSEERPYS